MTQKMTGLEVREGMSKDQVALITGAGRGIGRGIATDLSRTHQVVGTYRTRIDTAESLRDEYGVDIVQCDIGSKGDREALLEHIKSRYGRLDLVVNNAGMAPRERRDILDADEPGFDELIAVNVKGPHFLTQHAAPMMMERGSGRIIFITSISAYTVSTSRADYCISKAALSMSAALYAQRLAKHNVLVFEIRPGIIRTDMIARVEQDYETRIAGGLLPQGRMGETRDVARVVRAIADGLLDYSAGVVLDVDGGFRLRSL
jgi:3-oxoacyl-[acyl-carrier protein] reductase